MEGRPAAQICRTKKDAGLRDHEIFNILPAILTRRHKSIQCLSLPCSAPSHPLAARLSAPVPSLGRSSRKISSHPCSMPSARSRMRPPVAQREPSSGSVRPSFLSVSDMYSSRRCWFTARPRPSLSWQSCYGMVGLDLFISASVDEHFVYAELFLKSDPAASLALSHHSLIILSSIANTHRSQEGIRFHCSRRWKRRLLRSLLGGSHRRIQESRRRGGGGV